LTPTGATPEATPPRRYRPALERCAGDPERFLADHWGRGALLRRATRTGGFEDLLSPADVDRLVSSTSLRLPALRLVKDGNPIPTSRYTRTGRTGGQPISGLADPARIYSEFERGATIVLQGLHRFWPPLGSFCRLLEVDLGHPVQVNAYITPPGSQGLAVHRDDHDVFVLQVFGAKVWEVYEPSPEMPPAAPPTIQGAIGPGDALYIPRSFPHAARTSSESSGHLTIGILSYRWRDVIDQAVVMAHEEREDLDEPLPAGFADDPDALAAEIPVRLEAFAKRAASADPEAIAEALARRFMTTRQSVLPGQFEQALALPELTDGTVIRRRAGSMCRIWRTGDRLSVLLGDRELVMPAWLEPAVRRAASGEEFVPSDLHEWLDPEGALVLARRLIREGLLVAALHP
jgi:ribosomal protein L16 Arg81 hydroxylase